MTEDKNETFKEEVRLSNPDYKIEFHDEHVHTSTGTVGYTPTITDDKGNTFVTHLDKDRDY